MAVSRRWRLVGVGVVVVLVAAGWIVRHYHLLDRGSSTALSVDEARDRFRDTTSTSLTTTTAPAATVPHTTRAPAATTIPVHDAELPAPGVYVYTTTGGDAVDALAGASHDYPATTTITVVTAGCGVVQRWDVLVERWEEWTRCVDGPNIRQPAFTTYDQFFGQSQTDSYTCSGDARPADAAPATTWQSTCVQGDDTEVHDGTVVGTEERDVGGTAVATLHVRVQVTTEVDSDVQITDTWYRLGTDLVVAQSSHAATTNPSPVGDVHYTEDYEIHLESLTPLT